MIFAEDLNKTINKNTTDNNCLKTGFYSSFVQYTCRYCKKKFGSKYNLKIHTYTHTGERPHECHICGKRFIQKNCLIVHYTLHTGRKIFNCNLCGKEFNRKDRMRTHKCVVL